MANAATNHLRQQVESREDWDDFSDAQPTLPKPAVGVRVTEGSGDLTVVQLNGSTKALPKLALNQLEPVKFTGVTAVGEGIVSYRVYY